MKNALLAISLALVVTGCQTDADVRPANYDELAMATGHWEWDVSTLGWAGNRTPATEGYTRQLVFGHSNQLVLRRSGQPDYTTSYQLSMGPLPSCGTGTRSFPIVTFSTGESRLPTNERKTYTISQEHERQVLRLDGELACVDGGAYETYHWVAE